MATTTYTSLNNAPELVQQDQLWTANMYLALKSLGNDIDSANGWTSPGPIEPGSYSAPMETGTAKTELGAVKTPQSLHYTRHAQTVTANLIGITPFGNQVRHKNNLTPTVTYGTGDDAVATSGGTTTAVTLDDASAFSEGDMIEIAMPAGQPEYRRVDAKSSNTLTLDHPLAVAPADAAAVKEVSHVDYKVGGSRPQKYSGLITLSGNYSDRLVHFFNDLRVNSGNINAPDGQPGGLALNFEAFPSRENGEPIFMTERFKFADIA